MKKLLALLAAIGLTSTATSGVVSCRTAGDNDDAELTGIALAARNYLMTEDVLGHRDIVLASINDDEIIIMGNKIIEILKVITDLKFDFEGTTATVDNTTFTMQGRDITFEVIHNEEKHNIAFNFRYATELNIIAIDSLKDRNIMKSKAELTAQEFSLKNDLGFLTSHEGDVIFKSTEIVATKEIQEVSGTITIADDYLATKNIYEANLTLFNSLNLLNQLADSTWESNTYINGITSYDAQQAVFGIVPSSLHDAIALHTGDELTGDYLFIKDVKGTVLQQSDIESSGEIKSSYVPLEVTQWGLWDAKEGKEVLDFEPSDYQMTMNMINDIIQARLVSVHAITDAEGNLTNEYIPAWKRFADTWDAHITTSFQGLFGINPNGIPALSGLSTIDVLINGINDRNGRSFIRFESGVGFSTDDLGVEGIKGVMQRADNSSTLVEAQQIGRVGDPFNWGRNLSATHAFADYFNKYVHQGEKTVNVNGTDKTFDVQNKTFEVTYGGKTSSYTIQGIDPSQRDENTIAYFGIENQGLVFRLEDNNTSETITVEMTMEQFFEFNIARSNIKGMVLSDYK